MKSNDYETSDFALAVSLLATGYVIKNFDSSNPSRMIFIFEKSAGLEDVVEKFWDNRLRVNPKILFLLQRELKSRINQLKG